MKKHKLTGKMLCEWLSDTTNRSYSQTYFLFELLNRDFSKLQLLEMKIKQCFVSFCPSNLNEVTYILNL